MTCTTLAAHRQKPLNLNSNNNAMNSFSTNRRTLPPGSHPDKLPNVGDDVVASIHVPDGGGSMDIRAKVTVVHENGTLRIMYVKRTGKKHTKEVTTECKTWRHPTEQEKSRWHY